MDNAEGGSETISLNPQGTRVGVTEMDMAIFLRHYCQWATMGFNFNLTVFKNFIRVVIVIK